MGFTSTTFSTPNCLFFPRRTFPNLEFRVWKRRRLKSPKPRLLCLRNELGPPSDFFSLLSQNWIPPAAAALGFASAIALSLSSNQKKQIGVSDSNTRGLDSGEWILFTSPTPFNRFVLLRCPSISFGGGEFLEDVNDKLVKEERHYVRLDSGRIRVKGERENEENEEELEYQRVSLGTEDGGVISLDWPANLDLNQEHGLDTTVLLIPGAPEGSMDANVKSFVCECLKRGLFPVVMNPRGCAGSPLTTARLFTAADSDDICSAIQFITKARSWSTFMGVGWGYGANMLTKYLAEAGEKTPLTAATCIDNPFDLDEATRTSPYNTTIDKKLTRGLIDILKSNKELFQGRGKGFHVEKALLAESVRDFEEAISMISYGFDSLEEFYSSSSTRSLVGRLKIPVLFIQNDNGTVPLFSIPRGLIAENPFTSLLLCSCLPSNFTAISWYHQVTIEWLTAVELGLLKGRHPLLQDIDVTVNPSKSLALVEGRMPAANDRLDNVLNAAEFDSPDAYMDSMNGLLGKNGATAYVQFESNQFLEGKPNSDDEALSKKNGNNSIEASSPEDRESNLAESDRGQVLQTAQVVMNMLDATMPGTLKEEEKKKVLAAVARGETLIKALHNAVPEDVRGKLTSSVSEILQAHGQNLNFDGLLRVNQIANVSSALRSKIKEKSGNSDVRVEGDDHFSDKRVSARDVRDGSISQGNVDEHTGGVNGVQPQEEPANFSDLPESRSADVNGENMGSAEASVGAQNNGDKFDSDTSDVRVEGDDHFSDKRVSARDVRDGSISQGNVDAHTGGVNGVQPQEEPANFSDLPESRSADVNGENMGSAEASGGAQNNGDKFDSDTSSKQKIGQFSEVGEDGSDATTEVTSSSSNTGTDCVETIKQNNSSQDDEVGQPADKATNRSVRMASEQESSDQNQTGSSTDARLSDTSEMPATTISDGQLAEKGDDDSKSNDERLVQPLPYQNTATDSSFSVSQALDALTGLDDSTQPAVNSVLGVIEDVLTQLEEEKNDSAVKKENDNNDTNNHSVIKKSCIDFEIQKKQIHGDDNEDANRVDVESAKRNISNPKMENNTASVARKKNSGKKSFIVDKLVAANSFDVTGVHDHKNTSPLDIDQDQINDLKPEVELVRKSIQLPADEADHDPIPAKSFRKKQDDMSSSFVDEDDGHKVQTKTQKRDALMVGAVTAALGASAIVSQQEIFIGDGSSGTTCSYSKEKHVKTETAKDKEVVDDKQSNIVTSLAEKAMSVAAPIVPTKEGGEVDQERLVSMLAELGQKGGVLKLAGKLALLWGGLRGAMSLTDRLISFFRIAERPLLQRVLGFFGMALVLWCPVLVPLLPTFIHNWATQTSSRIVELACILGLYTAVAILIMQWGKRVRGHEYPLRQYGLDFMSSEKIQDFSTGFVGGTVLVLSVQCINALLGFAQLSWPLQLISSSVDLTTKMKAYGQLFLLAAQGILTAAGIAFVEELFFRSWLLEEIATDLGYQSAILLSALAFSLSQRSLRAIPGLWLLSLALSGARLRKQGSLFIPIGMRTGIMASNFILQMGGFMTHQPNSHLWIGGTHPSQPFSGVVGLFFALLLAIILYPRQSGLSRKTSRTIRP